MQTDHFASRRRLDNSLVLDFLSSSAAVFTEEGILSLRESNNLRLLLSGMQGSLNIDGESIMTQCLKQKSEYISILSSRYGERALYTNLLKHTLQPVIGEMRIILSALGQELVERSRLFFNRSLNFYDEKSRCERQLLYPSVLVDAASMLEDSGKKMDEVLAGFSVMIPHAMAGGETLDRKIDEKIADALGFTGLSFSSLSLIKEKRSRRMVSFAFETIAEVIGRLTEHLSVDISSEEAVKISLKSQNLKLQSQKFSDLDIPNSDSLSAWEARRLSLVETSWELVEQFNVLAKDFIDFVASQGLKGQPYAEKMPLDVSRRINFELVKKGINPGEAKKATGDLASYLYSHKIEPHELLESEFNKINPTLTLSSLDLLRKNYSKSSLLNVDPEEKKLTLARVEELEKGFKKFLKKGVTAVMACAFFIMMNSCGVKQDPFSDKLDLRPDVPTLDHGFSKVEESSKKTKIGKKNARTK